MVFNLKTMPGEQRRAEAGHPPGDRVLGRPRRSWPTTSTRAPTSPRTRWCRRASPTRPSRSRTSTARRRTRPRPSQALQAAGVQTPVTLNIEYTTDHYGPTSQQEYGAIKRQLEATGLFKVNLQLGAVDDVLEGAGQGHLPDLPAGLVPGLRRRRRLPGAVPERDQLRARALLRQGRDEPAVRQGRRAAAADQGGDEDRSRPDAGVRADPAEAGHRRDAVPAAAVRQAGRGHPRRTSAACRRRSTRPTSSGCG